MSVMEILKVIFLGIVEGITEWLPISSTGHMLLVDQFLHLNVSDAFKEMFFVVIQLGAILAVVVLFWDKMWPFQFRNKNRSPLRRDVMSTWYKVVVACIPGAAVTLLFDDYIEAHLHTPSSSRPCCSFTARRLSWWSGGTRPAGPGSSACPRSAMTRRF